MYHLISRITNEEEQTTIALRAFVRNYDLASNDLREYFITNDINMIMLRRAASSKVRWLSIFDGSK